MWWSYGRHSHQIHVLLQHSCIEGESRSVVKGERDSSGIAFSNLLSFDCDRNFFPVLLHDKHTQREGLPHCGCPCDCISNSIYFPLIFLVLQHKYPLCCQSFEHEEEGSSEYAMFPFIESSPDFVLSAQQEQLLFSAKSWETNTNRRNSCKRHVNIINMRRRIDSMHDSTWRFNGVSVL